MPPARRIARRMICTSTARLWSPLKDLTTTLAAKLVTSGLGPEQPDGNRVLDEFLTQCRLMSEPRVLELGTKRLIPGRSTRRTTWVPHAREYLGTDMESGDDVDIVVDVHQLTTLVGEEQFDVVISCSTFEHFRYPHLAAHQVMKALKIGGILFVHTHQSFPLHSHPHDYFRFSREALAGLFGTKMGFEVLHTDYEFPARVVGRHDLAASKSPAFMYVRLFGRKTSKTPQEYVYEF